MLLPEHVAKIVIIFLIQTFFEENNEKNRGGNLKWLPERWKMVRVTSGLAFTSGTGLVEETCWVLFLSLLLEEHLQMPLLAEQHLYLLLQNRDALAHAFVLLAEALEFLVLSFPVACSGGVHPFLDAALGDELLV